MSCCSEKVDSSSSSASGGAEKNKTSTKFSQTFNLLSQYLKNNPTTSFGDLTPTGMGSSGGVAINLFATNKSDHLLLVDDTFQQQEKEENEIIPPPPPPQMTIFYAGRIIVLDDLPLDKAKQIINLADNWITHPHLDLPIARKASLARFLQKRKERIIARAPYHDTSPSKQDQKPCLAESPVAHQS